MARGLGSDAIFIERDYFFQAQFSEYLHVVLVAIAADHHSAGAKFWLGRVVRPDLHFAVEQRQDECACPVGLVAFIVRVDDYCLACEQQFRV